MKEKIKNNRRLSKLLKHIHVKKFIVAYFVIFSVLCMGFHTYATGNVDGTVVDEEDAITDLEQDIPYTLGITVDTTNEEGTLAGTLQMLLVITVISLAPSIVVMMTSFTRIIVVFHFVRTALGTQSTPPNNVMIGLALFITLFILSILVVFIGAISFTERLYFFISPIYNSIKYQFLPDNFTTLSLFLQYKNTNILHDNYCLHMLVNIKCKNC